MAVFRQAEAEAGHKAQLDLGLERARANREAQRAAALEGQLRDAWRELEESHAVSRHASLEADLSAISARSSAPEPVPPVLTKTTASPPRLNGPLSRGDDAVVLAGYSRNAVHAGEYLEWKAWQEELLAKKQVLEEHALRLDSESWMDTRAAATDDAFDYAQLVDAEHAYNSAATKLAYIQRRR